MRLPLIVPTLLCVAVGSAQAVELAGVEVSGFASLGYVQSNHNNYLAKDSVDGSWDMNNLGVNFGYQASDRLRFAAQVYASNIGNATEDARYEKDFVAPTYSWRNGGVALDLAFAQYTFADQFGVRLGRVKQPYGFYNEVRDIDSVFGPATLPQGVYDNRTREYNFAVNGASVFGSLDGGGAGSLDYQLFGGKVDISTNGTVASQYVTDEFFLTDVTVGSVMGGQVFWNTPVEGLRVGVSMRQTKDQKAGVRFNPAYGFGPYTLPDLPMDVTNNTTSYLASLEYIHEDFTFQTEWQRTEIEQLYSRDHIDMVRPSPFIPPFSIPLTSDISTGNSWYVLASYRLGDLELGGFVSIYNADIAKQGDPNWNKYQQDYAIFGRLDTPIQGLVVKAEWHEVDGTGLLNVPDKQTGYFSSAPTTALHWNYVVLKTAYSF